MTASQPARAPTPSSASAPHHRAPRSVDVGLDRLSRAVVTKASRHGLEIEALGTGALFSGPRLYGEGTAPWILSPADTDPMVQAGLPIPARQQAILRRVVTAGMDFPAVYLAHQLQPTPGKKPDPTERDRYRPLSHSEAAQLLGSPPAPPATCRTAARLDRAAAATRRAAVIAGTGMALGLASPFLLAGSVLGGLDPAIVGALTPPGHEYRPGTNAAWFLLAHWNW